MLTQAHGLIAVAAIATAAAIDAASAATTATAATIAAASAAPAPATTAFFPRLRLVDGQGPAFEIHAIQGLAVVIHFHKPKAARSAGFPVGNHLSPGHRAVRLKQGQQVVGRAIPNQVAD